MALNKIGDDNLYIGGYVALTNKIGLSRANITHVVSVLRMNPNDERLAGFKGHLHIPVDDVDDEDLLQYFPTANAFIREGLATGGGVLVHCAMGKSRSATICIAFLLHRQPDVLDPQKALELIRQSRPLCEPNNGFMEQLRIYHQMGCPDNVVDHAFYKRWQYHRAVEESVACGRGPELEEIRFEDENAVEAGARADAVDNGKETEIRCRKCRRKLATSSFIIPHDPQTSSRKSHKSQKSQAFAPPSTLIAADCAHIFLHPLTWMRPSLFPTPHTDNNPNAPSTSAEPEPSPDSPLSGRLSCPNTSCGANLGKFSWPGMQCSCGTWVVPAIALARARVDVVDASVRKGVGRSGAGIRLPPGMVRGVQGFSLGSGVEEGNGGNGGGRGVL
ncbi:hypothetical protein VTO42DRAFT_8783 [Malbranchea cinnamomea]